MVILTGDYIFVILRLETQGGCQRSSRNTDVRITPGTPRIEKTRIDESYKTIIPVHIEELPSAVRDDVLHSTFHSADAVSMEEYR